MNLFELQAQISIGINKAINELTELGNKASRVATQINQSLGGDNEVNIETKKAEENIEEITDDLENFDNKLDDTESKSNSSSNNMISTFKKLGAAIAAAFAVDKIIDFGKATVQASAEVAAEEAAFTQIMGDYSEEAAAKVSKIADATGMVDTRLTPYMTSMTAKFKGLGYDVDEATDYAARGLNLAADASAFWDKSLDESMSHLNSFINGSYEGGEAIGLFANDTQMAAYAVEKGIVKNTAAWSKLDEATKQATRLEYAENMMKHSGATGQAAKESEAYANVQANLNEKWRQFKAQVGEPILQNFVLPAMQSLSNFITNTLSPAVQVLIEKIKLMVNWFKEHETIVKNVAIALGIATTGFTAYKIALALTTEGTKLYTLATKAASIAQSAWSVIVGIATGKITLMTIAQKALNAVMNANPILKIITLITALVGAFVLLYKNSETFRNAVNQLWGVIKNSLIKVFNELKPILKEVWNALKELWNVIKSLLGPVITWLVNLVKKAMPAIKGAFSGAITIIITSIKNLLIVVKAVFNNIKIVIQTALNVIKNIIKVFTSVLKGDWKGAWEGIKGIFSSVWNGIKSVAKNILNGISQIFTNTWNGIKSATSKIWNGIRDSVTQPMKKAMDTVKGYVDKIKGFFNNFKAKMKMPHFKVKGSLNPLNWLNNGLPKISVEWYKKGGIMTKPTMFDYNAATNTARVGGEAGAEAIAPIDTLLGYVQQAVKAENENLNYHIARIDNILASLLPNIANKNYNIMLDSNVLVGELAPSIDDRLGHISRAKERGR